MDSATDVVLVNTPASRVPLEIFLEIISYFEPAAQYKTAIADLQPNTISPRHSMLKSMALVCRHFYHHIFPFLFENIYVCEYDVRTGKPPLNFLKFCRSIIDGDERARMLATYVKRCAIVAFDLDRKYRPLPPPEEAQELSILSRALAHMLNLKELYLWRSSITNDLLQAVSVLPPLKLLRLDHCLAPKWMDLAHLSRLPPIEIAEMTANGTSTLDDFECDIGQNIARILLMGVRRLISDKMREGFLLQLIQLGPAINLQHLHLDSVEVERGHPEILSDALASLPSLVHLHITRIYYTGGRCRLFDLGPEPEVPDDEFVFEPCIEFPTLPLLEYIYAPVPALKAMVPDSVISSIGISSEHLASDAVPYDDDAAFWRQFLALLKQSRRPITTLDIPLAFYRDVLLAESLPDLRILRIRPAHVNWHNDEPEEEPTFFTYGPEPPMQDFWYNPEWMISDVLDSWAIHPKICELEFIYDREPAPHNPEPIVIAKEMVYSLQVMIPSLECVKFTYDMPQISGPTKTIHVATEHASNESSPAHDASAIDPSAAP